jgi:DUF1680 family protein/acetyl esterase/lipase
VAYIVKELAECQTARGTGYVGAIPDEDRIWNEVAAGNIHTEDGNLNGAWVPWYTEHKVLAGLVDAWTYTGNKQAKDVAIRLCDWIDVKFKGLTEVQWQVMLNAEHGGMNEALANMYAITGDTRYLALSRKFHHQKILDPLALEKDVIHGVHANTQIPKIIGFARQYELTGDERDHAIARYFWDLVVHHYSYVVGGNSDHERFAPEAGKLSGCLSATTTETCNSYNMLKLTGHLFELDPQAAYMDFYERTLYNHILASQNPETGMVLYYLPLASGTEKKFGSDTGDFWCCTGTGMENHTKYGKDIYYKSADGGLYVNLFIPSTLHWKERGAHLEMKTNYPEGSSVSLRIVDMNAAGDRWTMFVRRPWWARSGVRASVNGKPVMVTADAGEYITISRVWKKGDELRLELPMSLYTESMPDDPTMRALLYGPLVLAGRLGQEPVRQQDIPVFVATPAVMKDWIKPVPGRVDEFVASSNGNKIALSPLYKIYNERYAVYWDFFSAEQWKTDTPRTIGLYYPDSIPNSKPHPNEEERTTDEKGVVLVSKISRPTLTLFLPKHVHGNTPAVVICPGGGYWVNAVNIEGYDEAKVLNSWGVAAFVLTYRIPDSAYCVHPELAPLQDAQEAILQVRRHASEWHIDPQRVGIMGFSAGGHLASTAGTHFDKVLVPDPEGISVRPDWMILGYPVISADPAISHKGSFEKLLGKDPPDTLLRYFSNETQVTDRTPPAFLVQAQDDDGVSPENSIVFFRALRAHHVPAELHLYERGGHGFGLHLPEKEEQWMDRCRHWMQLHGWLK